MEINLGDSPSKDSIDLCGGEVVDSGVDGALIICCGWLSWTKMTAGMSEASVSSSLYRSSCRDEEIEATSGKEEVDSITHMVLQ